MVSGIEGRKYKLLLLDDNPSIFNAIGGALSNQGYCVKTSSSVEAAVEAMNTEYGTRLKNMAPTSYLPSRGSNVFSEFLFL